MVGDSSGPVHLGLFSGSKTRSVGAGFGRFGDFRRARMHAMFGPSHGQPCVRQGWAGPKCPKMVHLVYVENNSHLPYQETVHRFPGEYNNINARNSWACTPKKRGFPQ